MHFSKKDNPKKTVREFYGSMFEVFLNLDGWVKVRPTQDVDKAVDIVTPVSKKVCAYCPTDKCLSNIVGEKMVFSENFKDDSSFKASRINYFDIAKCRKEQGKVFFIVVRDTEPRLIEEGRCIWCKSGFVDRIQNVAEIRKYVSAPDRLKKYNWVVWRETDGATPYEEPVYGQMEGLVVDEANIILFSEPWKCKHCFRVFGYKGYDKEGLALFGRIVEDVRRRELEEFFVKFDVPQDQVVFKHAKCPHCSAEFDSEATSLKCLLQLTIVPAGFYVAKRRCDKCDKQYFVVSDVYDMHKKDKKYH